MIYNNRYKIELKGKELPPKSSIENIKGITSVEYNKRDHTVSVTIDEKLEDDAAEILQNVVSEIRNSGGEVVTEKFLSQC